MGTTAQQNPNTHSLKVEPFIYPKGHQQLTPDAYVSSKY